jgi:hypothetical protein
MTLTCAVISASFARRNRRIHLAAQPHFGGRGDPSPGARRPALADNK